MTPSNKIPAFAWQFMRSMNRRLVSRFKEGKAAPGLVLVLVTTGRRTGQRRETPLQFEQIESDYWVASARGRDADWVHNLQANPHAQVIVKGQCRDVQAEVIRDPLRIASFLEVRLARRPRMMGAMLRAEGLKPGFSHSDLVDFAAGKVVAILHPCCGEVA